MDEYDISAFHLLLICFLKVRWNYSLLLIFIGVRELKVRQIDLNIISGWLFIPIMAISFFLPFQLFSLL